jgi:hypothetical protein
MTGGLTQEKQLPKQCCQSNSWNIEENLAYHDEEGVLMTKTAKEAFCNEWDYNTT